MRSPGGVSVRAAAAALFLLAASAVPALAQDAVSVRIVSPRDGDTLDGRNVVVQLEITGAVLGGRASDGAFALLSLDDMPAVKSYSPRFTFRNVAAGEHRLIVELRRNDGDSFNPPAQSQIRFRLRQGKRAAPAGRATGLHPGD